MTDLVEVMARAICIQQGRDPDEGVKGIGSGILGVGEPTPVWKYAEGMVRAAVGALESAGYRVVPIEPTMEMRAAAREYADQFYISDGAWAWPIMLAAAPKVGK